MGLLYRKAGRAERVRKIEKDLPITNRLGLHARPAAMFVRIASRYRSEIWVSKEGEEVNGKSIMGLMMLAAGQGSKLRVRCEGPDADKAMVQQLGAQIRNHEHFAPSGANVNFVQVLGPNSIRVRTYERGVEGETLACGTGVTASALVSAAVHGFSSPVKVQVQGGDILEVSFNDQGSEFSDVKLTGPADFCFDGKIEI